MPSIVTRQLAFTAAGAYDALEERPIPMEASGFSHYRVVSRLGKGGMGEVFLAEDTSLRRKVALKFLAPEAGADEDALVREARAAAHLDHPFICKVYEVGSLEGRACLAMEYVDGLTVAERLDQGPVSMREALHVASEIADALQFAHARGVVHRDLKPSNVMLGVDGHVKVMDFGIAKRLPSPIAADASTASLGTAGATGHVVGTLAYMSPEQLQALPVDARSDVFAFGLLLHEMLTGRHPFARATALETASAILRDTPAPLELPDTPVPPLLEHIVSRCLEKERQRRYQSLADVQVELESLRTPTAPSPQAPTPARRRWVGWAAMAAAVTLAGAVLLRPLSLLDPEPALAFTERDWLLVTDFNNRTSDPVFDRSLRLALEVALAQSQWVNVFPQARVAATLQRMQRGPEDRLDEATAIEVATREGIRGVLACDIDELGGVYSLTARLVDPRTRAAALTDSVTVTGKQEVLAALGRLASRVRSNLGESIRGLSEQNGELPQVTTASLDALKLYAESLKVPAADVGRGNDMLRQALDLDPEFALAHAELGRRYYLAASRAAHERGEQHLARALALTNRLTLRERLWIQAVAEDSRGNRERAVSAFKTYLGQYPDDTAALFRLSWTQMAVLHQIDEAVAGFARLIQIDPNHAAAQVNLATALGGKGDFGAAITAYQRAFELDPSFAVGPYINHEYGFTLIRAGRPDEALRVFERMKREGIPVQRARGYRSTALLAMLRGQYGAAEAELRGAIALDQSHGETLSEFRDRLFLVSALDARARNEDARREWRAIDRLVSTELVLSPDWLLHLVRAHARRGRLAEARRYLARMREAVGRLIADGGVARNLDNEHMLVTVAEAEIDLADGRTMPALARLEPAQLYLKDPGSLFTLATALAAAGQPREAIERFEELLDRAPLGVEAQQVWLEAHLALGRVYEEQQRPADARRTYQALVDRWKDADRDVVLLREVSARLRHLGPDAAAR